MKNDKEKITIEQGSYAHKMDSIASRVGIQLRALGYQKSKRIFNRIQSDGIVHVIEFQMGRKSLQGKFTIELGVFVPEFFQTQHQMIPQKFVRSYDCEERERLGYLIYDDKDKWWDLRNDEKKVTDELLDLLTGESESYFKRFYSREKLLDVWEQGQLKGTLPERKKLFMAILLMHIGEKERANKLLSTEFGNQYKTAFLEYAQNIAVSAGLNFPTLK